VDRLLSSAVAGAELLWAERVSRRLVEPLGSRWRHTVGVAERAKALGGGLTRDEADLLVAAAYVHDVGYASELVQTGFHPVDGARFARAAGYGRLAGLVAHHSRAAVEAQERGLEEALSEFEDERSIVPQALTYCDLTTDTEGRPVEARDRLAEIQERYGAASPTGRALDRAAADLMRDVEAVETALAEGGSGVPPAGHVGCC
jgi:HD superfamily phosphodiesterase